MCSLVLGCVVCFQAHFHSLHRTSVLPGILRTKELDLLAYVVVKREMAFAWEQSEQGSFSCEYSPDYKIPTIEHIPWQTKPIRISDSLVDDVREEIRKGEAAGRFEPTTSSYRSPSSVSFQKQRRSSLKSSRFLNS